ncbi:MAG TPA: threonine synthase [Campylobacterales bacterium]|nr:threonine synthase [Campylobacterales bacterium]
MNFIETRGNQEGFSKEVTFSQALLSPSASFGGLYVPQTLPPFDASFFDKTLNYKALAKKVLTHFEIDIEEKIIDEALALYDKFDNPSNPTPLVKIKEKLFVNELYHGPTRAFKDMALQPFGYILSHLAQKEGQKYLILAATSGDTGPAALESFKNKENIQIACLYPDGGTSDVQRLQMVTEDGENLKVIGIKGNFDDAQHALKTLLASDTFKKELEKNDIKLSAANSVNFGRIIFQIIYHLNAYLALLAQNEIQEDEKIYITVPSGNFGNALGAYYAKRMGLPIEKILITSNANNVLAELIQTGRYDIRDKNLILTLSPAMDILKSSNVERILFDMFGSEKTKQWMDDLNEKGFYQLSAEELTRLQEDFSAIDSDDAFTKETISAYAKENYIMDPHTATCLKADGILNKKPLCNILCSTAEWTKFAPTMMSAIKKDSHNYHDKEALSFISKSLDITITPSIEALFSKKVYHDSIINKDDIENEILKFIL